MAATIEAILAHQEEEAKKGNNQARVSALGGLRAHIAHVRKEGHLDEGMTRGLLQPKTVFVSAESPFKFQPARKPELLTPSQLVDIAHEEAKRFVGIDVPVSEPSELFIETQKIAEGEGFGIFDPIHFISVTLSQDAKYPGFKIKPQLWFYDQIKEGNVSKSALQINEFWALFDASRRPDYDGGRQLFKDDPLSSIVAQGRAEGRIAVPSHVSHVANGSRFGVSMDDQDKFVFPSLGEKLRLTENLATGTARIRRSTLAEFNYAGNIRYPHLGEANTWEGFEDLFGAGYRLAGGYSGVGGLADVNCWASDDHNDSVGFRPLVAFPSKT